MNAVVVKAGEGHALRLGDVEMVVKEDGTHTRGALGLAEFEVPPQGHDVPPAHIHATTCIHPWRAWGVCRQLRPANCSSSIIGPI
jgi:hypothetical protein